MSIGTGTKLGQYEVQDFIGQGAMGVVYRAYHAGLERTGAVKVMQAITPDADTVARFRHEAQAIARLRHPNIVDVYDFGEFQGTPYMIVEYVAGGSLAARMAHGPLDRPTALRYLHGIAAGLDYAHGHGIVHRDIKPANVLVAEDDSPVLADFGLAKLMHGSSLKSMTGVTTGTPAYMAPEQVTGGQVGPAADRYSLATIAYEMLTGVIPFDGEALMELLYAQVHRYPSAPSTRDQSLGPEVDAVIMRGLAKNPSDRWESCAAFVDALEAALQNAPAPAGAAPTMVMAPPVAAAMEAKPAAHPQPATVAMAFEAPAPPPAAPATPKSRTSRRRWVVLAAGAVVVLLLIGVFALVALARSPTLTLSSSTVAPGEDIVVSATRLPANVNGEIQLFSAEHTFPFRANASGAVSIDITIPHDVGFGDHLLRLCYNGSCHAQTTLHVIQRVAFANASPSPSAGATVTPTPPATPTPTATPKPTAPPSPRISISNYQIKAVTGTETVAGINFAPGSTITVTFKQGVLVNQVMGTTAVYSNGSWSFKFTVPHTATAGYAYIKSCGTYNGCYDATVQVVA